MITIKKSRIYIPMKDIIASNFKNPFKLFIKDAQWDRKNDRFWVIASAAKITEVEKLFRVSLDYPEDSIHSRDKYLIDVSEFKTRLRAHQLQALEYGAYKEFFGYFMEPGLGKTKTIIDNATLLNRRIALDTVFVCCPKSAISVWLEELEKHGDFKNYIIYYWDRENVIRHGVPHSQPFEPRNLISWLIMNPEGLTQGVEYIQKRTGVRKQITNPRTALGYKIAEQFLILPDHSMIVVDESTMICKPFSLRTQQLISLRKNCKYKRILTGTPFANDLIDVYPQMKWLDPETVGYRSYWSWRDEYCITGGYKNKQIMGYRKRDEIRQMIYTFGYRCRTRDVLDLPEPIYQKRWIELEPKAKKLYNKIVDETLIILESGEEINVKQITTQLIKLQQITGGMLYDEDKKAHMVSIAKIEELWQILREIGDNQVIIWCHYTSEVEFLSKELAKLYEIQSFEGKMDVTERKSAIKLFREGYADIFVIQDDTGHLSLTLNAATYAIFYSNHTRPLVREQAERRNWRDGQRSTVVYIDLLCKGLRDHDVYSLLHRKIDANNAVINATKEEIKQMLRRA